MPLVIAPFFAPNSQYRPNLFLMSMTSANPLVLAQATIVVNGSSVTSQAKSPLFSLLSTYYFEFDVSKVLQTESAPTAQAKTSIFPDNLNSPYNQQNFDCHTYVGLIVSYYYNDPITGLLTQFPTIDTVPFGYYATNGTRQTRDFMGMNEYVLDPLLSSKPFLTNRPNPYSICENENLYLSFIPYLSDTFLVQTYDSNDVVIDSGLAAIAPNATYVPTTIGVGMPNLATQTYFQGSVNINNPSAQYYTISVGNKFAFGLSYLFLPTSETHRYIIERNCCEEKRIRLHWMNRLGGVDAYTFPNGKQIVQKSKSNQAQKPLSFNYSIPPTTTYDKGLFKYSQEALVVYEVESEFYDEDFGSWLSEIITSPEVYFETPYGLISVIIEDSDMTILESDELISLKIRFIEANRISIQQN